MSDKKIKDNVAKLAEQKALEIKRENRVFNYSIKKEVKDKKIIIEKLNFGIFSEFV